MKTLIIIVICITGLGLMGPTLANISDEVGVSDYIFPSRKAESEKRRGARSLNTQMVQEIAADNPALALQRIEEELTRVDNLRDNFEEYTDELFYQYTFLLRESKETEADYLLLAMQEKNQDENPQFNYENMGQVGKSLKAQRFTMSNVLQEYVNTRDSFREGKNNYISLIHIRALLTQETEGEVIIGLEPNSRIRVENIEQQVIIAKPSPFRDTKFEEEVLELRPKSAYTLKQLKGKLLWPVIGNVQGDYGIEKDGKSGTGISNPGIEISTSKRSIVRVVHSGVVSDIFSLPRYGKIVIVDHETFSTAYGNLEDASVAVGDSLRTRQKIGRAAEGSTETSGMVFFGLFDGQGMQVNPVRYIKSGK